MIIMVASASHDLGYRILGSLLFIPILALFCAGGKLALLGGGVISAGVAIEFGALISTQHARTRNSVAVLCFSAYLGVVLPVAISDVISLDITHLETAGMLCVLYIVALIWLKRFALFLFLVMACLYSLGFLLGLSGGIVAVLITALAISAFDIGAYFSGRLIGGPKLAPRISPSKTWSGSCGGIMATIFVLVPVMMLEIYAVSMVVIWAIVTAVLAQIGDLIESHLKRRLGVKDSSRIIPGHGGFLDRFDGYLTVLPVLAVSVAFGVVVLPDISFNITPFR